VRIETAFIAGHVEVDPVTESLDVRSGFQNYVRVPSLPFRYDVGLGMVVQIGMDEYDRPFTLEIVVDRVEDGRVMHQEDFTFEIPSESVPWTASATTTRSPSPCRSSSTT
jgi:hypothetical protein